VSVGVWRRAPTHPRAPAESVARQAVRVRTRRHYQTVAYTEGPGALTVREMAAAAEEEATAAAAAAGGGGGSMTGTSMKAKESGASTSGKREKERVRWWEGGSRVWRTAAFSDRLISEAADLVLPGHNTNNNNATTPAAASTTSLAHDPTKSTTKFSAGEHSSTSQTGGAVVRESDREANTPLATFLGQNIMHVDSQHVVCPCVFGSLSLFSLPYNGCLCVVWCKKKIDV
jgi:hypothetical protein